jgi:phenylacetate-CoA ligase
VSVGVGSAVIWDPVETLDRESLRALQLERLRLTVARVLAGQPRGAELLAAGGITSVGAVGALEDIRAAAFMTKRELRDSYPFGLFAVPREQVIRLHASSGTHGKATVVGYTRADLEAWTDLMARLMTMAGVRPGMLIHNANGYGLFTGGFGYHQGGELLGCTILPVSGGFTARQVTLMHDMRPDVLVATPSYALVLAQAARDAGFDPTGFGLKLGLFGGEASTDRLRRQLDRELGFTAINSYGLSELCGPGVACECLEQRDGLHIQEDHFLVEVIEPQSGRVLDEGEEGELVFTTLTKEALPLIRYRTGDLGRVSYAPCACGRTTARIVSLRGRIDDMITVRGVNLYPSSVEHLLLGVAGVAPHYRLLVERPAAMDEVTLECEVLSASDAIDRDDLSARISELLRENTGLRIAVSVLEPGTIPRSEGKAVRVVDNR